MSFDQIKIESFNRMYKVQRKMRLYVESRKTKKTKDDGIDGESGIGRDCESEFGCKELKSW